MGCGISQDDYNKDMKLINNKFERDIVDHNKLNDKVERYNNERKENVLAVIDNIQDMEKEIKDLKDKMSKLENFDHIINVLAIDYNNRLKMKN